MTTQQLHILQHSLGLDEFSKGRMYRNNFCTGPGSDDWKDCCELAELGLMYGNGASTITGWDHCFTVTEAGVEAMREASPNHPKPTRSQLRYQDFLRADSGMKFIEWVRWNAAFKSEL